METLFPLLFRRAHLTPKQHARVREIMHSAAVPDWAERLHHAEETLVDMFLASAAAPELQRQLERIADIRARLLQENLRVLLDVRALLTAEQLQAASEMNDRLKTLESDLRPFARADRDGRGA